MNMATNTAETIGDNHQTVGTPFVDNAKLSMRNVNVFYGEKQAIFDVGMDIGTNEVMAMSMTSMSRRTFDNWEDVRVSSSADCKLFEIA